MALIRINALPNEAAPSSADSLPIDGANTRKTSIGAAVLAGRPTASQAEAEAGTDPLKAMTPLTTQQAVTFYGLTKNGNLSGIANPATARTNLGLGTAATANSSDFATAAQGTNADDAKKKADGLYYIATAVAAATIDNVVTMLRTTGYSAADGVGAAVYRLKAGPEADEPGQLTSNGGAKRWGLAVDAVTPEMCGAKGDYDPDAKTGTDDTVGIMTAIRFADYAKVPVLISSRHKVSFFDYGTVSGIDRDTNGNRYALFLKSLGDVTIIGRGGGLWFSGTNRSNYAYTIHAEDCASLSIYGDLTFDWVDLPYVQGTVTAIDPNYIEVLLEWAPTFTDVQRVNKWSQSDRINVKTLRDRPSALFDTGSAITQQSGLTYRISRTTGTWDVTGLVVGDLVSADHQIYMCGAVSSFRAENVYIGPGVKIRHGAGIAVWLRSGRRAIIEDLEINTAPGSLNLLSSSADGVHINGFKERSVKASRIYRTGDDCVNHSSYLTPVTARASARVFTLQYSFPFVNPTVGDRIRLYRTSTGVTQDVHVVSFVDPGIPDTNSSTYGSGYSVTVDADTDASLADGTWNAIFIDNGLTDDVSGNRMGFNRGRGVLVSTTSPIIKDNRIEKTGTGIICATNSTEFGKADMLLVEGNVLIECNYPSEVQADYAAIIVQGQIVGTTTISPVLGTISATKNTVIKTKSTGILIQGAVTGLISDNDFFDVATAPVNPSAFGSDAMAIAVDTVTNAYVGGNRNMQGASLKLGVNSVTNLRVGSNDNIIVPFVAQVVTGGFNSLRAVSDPSAVNFFEVQGGITGFSPIIRAAGPDANIAAILAGKGFGSAQLWANGSLALEGYNAGAGTSVNWVRAQGQIAGFEVALTAQGSDTNIDFAIAGKGTGVLRFGTWTSNGDAAVNGYITIKDLSGNIRKLATIA